MVKEGNLNQPAVENWVLKRFKEVELPPYSGE
jgi:hypothetical protein